MGRFRLSSLNDCGLVDQTWHSDICFALEGPRGRVGTPQGRIRLRSSGRGRFGMVIVHFCAESEKSPQRQNHRKAGGKGVRYRKFSKSRFWHLERYLTLQKDCFVKSSDPKLADPLSVKVSFVMR